MTPTAIASQPAALGTHVQAAQHRANTSETLVYEAKAGYHYCYVGDSLTPPYSAAIDTCAGQRNSNVDIQADEWFTAKASIHGITYSQEWRSLVREFAGGYTDYAVYRE